VQDERASGIYSDVAPFLAQRQRSDRAFERLYRRHAGDVYRYALVVLRNPADAEDVTQTTFLNAFRAYERGERPRSPQNWLIAIAHNVCRQRFRQSAGRPNEIAFDEELHESAVDDEQPISAEDIRRALGYLPFSQRAALVMRELEGRSYAEIAEILGFSLSAVETLIFRARRALREQLESSLTCSEAELAVSRQLDGRLSRKERGALRAHLRECDDCSRFARSQRAQRGALRSLAAIPLPQSLTALFGGGGATAGGGLAVKAAALGAGALVATGVGYEGVKHGVVQHPAGKQRPVAAGVGQRLAPASKLPVVPAGVFASDLKPFRGIPSDLKPFRGRAVGRRSNDPSGARPHPGSKAEAAHARVAARKQLVGEQRVAKHSAGKHHGLAKRQGAIKRQGVTKWQGVAKQQGAAKQHGTAGAHGAGNAHKARNPGKAHDSQNAGNPPDGGKHNPSRNKSAGSDDAASFSPPGRQFK
jgi:RNA polymerase sigma factor (sigma-70 family)